MNRVALLILILTSLNTFINAEEPFEKIGFFTNADCAKKGNFRDCYLESYSCGYEGCFKETLPTDLVEDNFVLFVHDEGKNYSVDVNLINRSEIDKVISKNNIKLIGEYNSSTNTIFVKKLKVVK